MNASRALPLAETSRSICAHQHTGQGGMDKQRGSCRGRRQGRIFVCQICTKPGTQQGTNQAWQRSHTPTPRMPHPPHAPHRTSPNPTPHTQHPHPVMHSPGSKSGPRGSAHAETAPVFSPPHRTPQLICRTSTQRHCEGLFQGGGSHLEAKGVLLGGALLAVGADRQELVEAACKDERRGTGGGALRGSRKGIRRSCT